MSYFMATSTELFELSYTASLSLFLSLGSVDHALVPIRISFRHLRISVNLQYRASRRKIQ
jgi:hypothetical protein